MRSYEPKLKIYHVSNIFTTCFNAIDIVTIVVTMMFRILHDLPFW